MAVTFDGGVILGADSRTSTGSYVANRVSDKIVPIHDYVWACRSGSAADTQAVVDNVKHYLDAHRYIFELCFRTISPFVASYSCDQPIYPTCDDYFPEFQQSVNSECS